MSVLNRAEERTQAALGRLEQALRSLASGERAADPRAALEQAALARDCELLRAECDGLRRELDLLRERQARAAAMVEAVEDRLDGAIAEIDDLAGE
jgi:hypothetical protein